MGLLDKLWDDTVAGPCPDTGLRKLRTITLTNSAMATASIPAPKVGLRRIMERRATAEFHGTNNEAIQVTQSITIIKPPHYLPSLSIDSPSSPAESSPPISPSSGNSVTLRERENPWRSNKHKKGSEKSPRAEPRSDKHKKGSEKSPRAEPRSPAVYNWVIFSVLDR